MIYDPEKESPADRSRMPGISLCENLVLPLYSREEEKSPRHTERQFILINA